MRVAGLDLSLTSTGFATDGRVETWTPPRGLVGAARLSWYRNKVLTAFDNGGPRVDLAVLEGYSFGSKFSAGRDPTPELGGVVKCTLLEAGIPVAIVAPKQLVKYATGSGASKKAAVLVQAVKAFPEVDFANDDEADAMWLWHMGWDHLGTPLVHLAADKRAVLLKVAWPAVAEVAS